MEQVLSLGLPPIKTGTSPSPLQWARTVYTSSTVFAHWTVVVNLICVQPFIQRSQGDSRFSRLTGRGQGERKG